MKENEWRKEVRWGCPAQVQSMGYHYKHKSWFSISGSQCLHSVEGAMR